MKKGTTIIIILLVIIALAAAATAGYFYYDRTYITIGAQRYLRGSEALKPDITSDEDFLKLAELQSLKKLDVSDTALTIAQYDALQASMPNCDILWNVPFQGGYISNSNTTITVSTLTQEDIDLLEYLPGLTAVDATQCNDLEILTVLMETYPQLDVAYNVTIGGQSWPKDTTEITIASAENEEMMAMLPYLPQVTTVTLTEIPEDPDGLLLVQETYPAINFSWQLNVCGVTVDVAAEEIDLSNIPMENTEELESCLKYMPNLTKVDMCYCGISNEEMEALNNRHENILFVWMVEIKGMEFRTDVTEMMPVKHDLWVNNLDCYNLRYFTELIALDLGHMFIDNCDFVAYMPHLKYLILADTDVSDLTPLTGLEELIFLEIFMCPIQDYSPLTTLTALEDLNICYTYGDPDIIAQMTWLDRLWWGQVQSSRISNAQRQALREALPDTEIEYEPHSSTGAGWRMGQNYYDMRDIFGMSYMTT